MVVIFILIQKKIKVRLFTSHFHWIKIKFPGDRKILKPNMVNIIYEVSRNGLIPRFRYYTQKKHVIGLIATALVMMSK